MNRRASRAHSFVTSCADRSVHKKSPKTVESVPAGISVKSVGGSREEERGSACDASGMSLYAGVPGAVSAVLSD